MATLMASLEPEGSHSQLNAEELAVKQWETYSMLVDKHRLLWDDDPLLWWRCYGQMVPELKVMARAYLGVQATSCSSERPFSKAGFIVNKYRTSLNTDNVGMLTFLATNNKS